MLLNPAYQNPSDSNSGLHLALYSLEGKLGALK